MVRAASSLSGKGLVDKEPPLPPVTINAVNYPCDGWEVVEEGRILDKRWERGFMGGMGDYLGIRPGGTSYSPFNVDVMTPPFLRVKIDELDMTSVSITFDRAKPLHGFYAKSAGGDNFVFILNDRFAWKIDLANNNQESQKDFGAGAVCGRPALFEGKWHIPLGATVNAVTLDTIANDGAGADTYSDIGTNKALGFAAGLDKGGIAQLVRAHTTNLVDLSANGTDWTGDDFEVGDSSLPITDIITWAGEVLVIKPDAPYLFDVDGNSRPIQDFVGRSADPILSGSANSYVGSNSTVAGQFAYWVHSSGMWRLIGDRMFPVGIAARDDFINVEIDGVAVFGATEALKSVSTWGRYIYASAALTVHVGVIEEDGLVRWLWHLRPDTGLGQTRNIITEGNANPILWIVSGSQTLTRYNLSQEGSTRQNLDTAREAGSTPKFTAPITDFGLLEKTKQLRRFWFIAEDLDANNTIQTVVTRDRGSTETLGSAATSSGLIENTWASGTNDTCREVNAGFRWVADGNKDPRVRAFGIEAVTPSIYRVLIPLTSARLEAGHSIRQSLKNLRDLKGGAGVTIKGSGEESATFTGKIVSVREKAVRQAERRIGYVVTLLIERYDWADGK